MMSNEKWNTDQLDKMRYAACEGIAQETGYVVIVENGYLKCYDNNGLVHTLELRYRT